ncbi:rho-related protein racC-like [Chironomus tepperi]|uniref:rho-related protein racC-like n=1 Tax=Chironomus tepperi TaxID=113505 RepID=UPI00391F4B41
MESVNIVIVGTENTGKTCFFHRYANDIFLKFTPAKNIDFKDFETVLDDKCCAFSLFDTPGQDNYEHLRPLAYNNVSAFIICYSISNRDSYERISMKVIPELMRIFEWPVPVILVATKIDFRDNPNVQHKELLITTDEGLQLANKIRANKFIECSAKLNIGIKEAIHEALRAAHEELMKEKPQKKVLCFSCRQS